MEIALVNNLDEGSYSPCGERPGPAHLFILNKSNFFLLREGQANHAQTQRQAKWSQSRKIFWAKSIDEKPIFFFHIIAINISSKSFIG